MLKQPWHFTSYNKYSTTTRNIIRDQWINIQAIVFYNSKKENLNH